MKTTFAFVGKPSPQQCRAAMEVLAHGLGEKYGIEIDVKYVGDDKETLEWERKREIAQKEAHDDV